MRVNGPGTAIDLTLVKNEQAAQQVAAQQVVEKPVPDNKSAKPQAEQVHAVNGSGTQPVKLEDSVDLANAAMQISSYNLQFRVHEESGRIQVKVIDSQSGDVIKEIPSEQMLELSASIKEMLEKFDKMVGLLVDECV